MENDIDQESLDKATQYLSNKDNVKNFSNDIKQNLIQDKKQLNNLMSNAAVMRRTESIKKDKTSMDNIKSLSSKDKKKMIKSYSQMNNGDFSEKKVIQKGTLVVHIPICSKKLKLTEIPEYVRTDNWITIQHDDYFIKHEPTSLKVNKITSKIVGYKLCGQAYIYKAKDDKIASVTIEEITKLFI